MKDFNKWFYETAKYLGVGNRAELTEKIREDKSEKPEHEHSQNEEVENVRA